MQDISMMFKSPQKNNLEDYSEDFQLSLVKCMIEDVVFLQQIYDTVDPEYFTFGYLQQLVNYILAFYESRKRIPKIDELKQDIKTASSINYRDEIIKNIDRILKLNKYGKDYVSGIAIKFFKSQEMIKAVSQAIKILQKPYEEQDFDKIYEGIKTANNTCTDSNKFYDWKKDFPLRYPSEEDLKKALSTSGIRALDTMMQGGLGIGEVAVVTGGSGMGKSMFLVNAGISNIMAEKKVWHITLELSNNYTAKRYDARYTGIASDKLHDEQDAVYKSIHETEGNVKFTYLPAYSYTMENIFSDYDRLIGTDFTPDTIIIDYADLLLSSKKQGFSTDSLYNALGIVYNRMRNFGMEVKTPIWSASQVNRKGVETGGTTKDLSDMSDSMKKVHFADVIIALQRTDEMKERGLANLLIKKNRRGPSDVSIPLCNVDLSRCYFEEDTDKTQIGMSSDSLKFYQRNIKTTSATLEERMRHAKPNDVKVVFVNDLHKKSMQRQIDEELNEEKEIKRNLNEEKE